MMVASQFIGDCGLTTLSLVSLTANEAVVILKQARFSQAVPSSVFSFGFGGGGGGRGGKAEGHLPGYTDYLNLNFSLGDFWVAFAS